MKRLIRYILPAVIAVGALAGSGTAMAFPTSSTVYPSSGSCYGKTVATALLRWPWRRGGSRNLGNHELHVRHRSGLHHDKQPGVHRR